MYLHAIEHMRDFMLKTGHSPGLVCNDQIVESMHSVIDGIKSKGLRRTEPGRDVIFSDENHESASYRKASTEIFSKKNESALDCIKRLKPLAVSRTRKQSLSSDFVSCSLAD